MSPHIFGIPNAISAYTETQLDMVFSAQAPRKIHPMHKRSPFVRYFEPAAFAPLCPISISGSGAPISSRDATTGRAAQKNVRYIQYSFPTNRRNKVLIRTTPTNP